MWLTGGKKPEKTFSQEVSDWFNKSPEEKHAIYQKLMEYLGGTGGAAIGGGLLSIPMAGAGAVLGRIAADAMAADSRPAKLQSQLPPPGRPRRLAAQRDPAIAARVGTESPEKTTAANESWNDLSSTFERNAAGQAIGMAAPIVAGKALEYGKKLVKLPFQPSVDQSVMNTIADAAGIPTTLGMRTDKPLVQLSEAALEHFPTSSGTIRAAREAAYEPYEQRLLGNATALSPESATKQEVGEKLKDALQSNFDAIRNYFKPKYAEIADLAKDAPISVANVAATAKEAKDAIPEGAYALMSPKARGFIDRLAGLGNQVDDAMTIGGKAIPPEVAEKLRLNPAMASVQPPTAALTFPEASEIRTTLLEAQRALERNPLAPAFDRKVIPQLAAAVDDSISNGLAATPEALRKWRYLSDEYGDAISKLKSPTALKITRSNVPENLPHEIATHPTQLGEAEQAVTPMFGSESSNPMGALRRQQLEETIEGARTLQPTTGDQRYINPRTLEKKITGNNAVNYRALIGDAPYENLVQDVNLGKALTAPQALYDNTSRTMRMGAAMKAGKTGLVGAAALGSALGGDFYARPQDRPAIIAGSAAALGIPYVAAKGFANPAIASWLTSPTATAAIKPGGLFAGALGRLPFVLGSGKKKTTEEDPDFVPAADQDPDFIPAQ